MFRRSLYSVLTFAAVAAPLAAQRTEVYTIPPSGGGQGRGYVTMTSSGRAVIGVTITTRPTDADTLGATVAAVTPGGGAAQAGILAGDIITKFNGTALADRRARGQSDDEVPAQSGPGLKLIELVSRVSPGDTVAVEWRHDRQRKTAKVVTQSAGTVWASGDEGFKVFQGPGPGAYTYSLDAPPRLGVMSPLDRTLELNGVLAPDFRGPGDRVFIRMGGPLAGIQFAPINADLGRYFGVTDGILVLETPDTSAHIDFKGGDVIVSVDGRKPTGVEQLMRIIGSYNDDETVSFDVMRDKRHVAVSAKAEDLRSGGRQLRIIERDMAPTRPPQMDRVPMDAPAPQAAPRQRTPRNGT